MVLVAQSDAEAQALVEDFNEGTDDLDQPFDANLTAQYILFMLAIENLGEYLLEPNDAGETCCPLCEVQASMGTDPGFWINTVADTVLSEAKKADLLRETCQ